MTIPVVILFLCSLPFWGGKEYICYDDLKIADVREKGTFNITYIRRDITFRELVRIKIRTRNYNGTSVRNYDFYFRYGKKLRFQLSIDRHYHFMVYFEEHLEKIASGHDFEFDRKRTLVFS
ncbi:MAG: hypothetical protein LBQ60_19810 [Bacteroidales bacterium]|nr:hypothetical protein [Bacteroidales bacterium]